MLVQLLVIHLQYNILTLFKMSQSCKLSCDASDSINAEQFVDMMMDFNQIKKNIEQHRDGRYDKNKLKH